MAINVNVQDLINHPGNVKSMTIDQVSVVPTGYEGDEQYVLKFSTTAYSDITNRTAIPDYYITEFKSGWVRSSGFTGNSGKFALTASYNRLLVKLDTTVSGSGNGVGTGYYEVILDYDEVNGTPVDGSAIAEDLEIKIRALGITFGSQDIGFKSAYENASVEYKNGKFWIVSGSVSKFYSSSYADVSLGAVNDAARVLGFDLKTNSLLLDASSTKEALVTSGYTTGASGIVIDQNIGADEGNCLVITDGTISGTDYFQLDDQYLGGVLLTFSPSVIKNNYVANQAKVQLLREQDPEGGPAPWFDNIDKVTRHGVKTIINAIDFSE